MATSPLVSSDVQPAAAVLESTGQASGKHTALCGGTWVLIVSVLRTRDERRKAPAPNDEAFSLAG